MSRPNQLIGRECTTIWNGANRRKWISSTIISGGPALPPSLWSFGREAGRESSQERNHARDYNDPAERMSARCLACIGEVADQLERADRPNARACPTHTGHRRNRFKDYDGSRVECENRWNQQKHANAPNATRAFLAAPRDHPRLIG